MTESAGARFAEAHNAATVGELLLVNLTTGQTSVFASGADPEPGLDEVVYTRRRAELTAEQGQAMLDVADMFAAVKRG